MPVQTAATDAELVARAAGGDHSAFTELFERYADPVHDHVARWSRDPTLAADATQEAFVALLRNLDTLRDGQAVLAWLLRTARNRAIDQLRRTRSETTVADPRVPDAVLAATIASGDATPEAAALTHETAELVWDVAAGLDERTFTVLDLSVRRGLSGPEIAAVMDTTPANANVLVHRMRERMRTLFGAALLLRVPAQDCPTLEALRASAPDPVDLAAARRIRDHAEECVTCGPRRARAIAPLRAYGALAQVRAPVAVRTAVGAAAGTHFGTASGIGRLRRGTVGTILVALLLLVAGIANGLRGPSSDVREGPPTVAAEPVIEPSPTMTPTPSSTLEPLPPASPLPLAPPEPTVAPSPSPEPQPSPSPSPSPSPEPVVLEITIEAPQADARIVADQVDQETDREVGTVPVQAAVTASPDAGVTIAWTSDLAPGTVLHTGADGAVELWLSNSCEDTAHQLRATATDTATGDTATAAVPVTMTHTCTAPEVEITNPQENSPPARAEDDGEGTYAATVAVAASATRDDANLNWTWTSDRMDGVLLQQSQGEITLTAECDGDPVTHVVTATASADDGSTGSDQVEIVVDPPPCPRR